jgi:general secretion pathway protein K
MHAAGRPLQEPPARERGMALLVVLWIVVAAALIVSAFNATVKSGVSFIGSEVQLSKSDALLDAGVEIAAARLIDEEESRRWVADGRAYAVAFAGAKLSIAIRDTGGRIDINKSDPELLMGLLRQFAGSEAKAGLLRDRILLARGEMPGKPAEKQVNANDGAVKKPSADAPAFVDVAQLRGLEGMTPKLYAAIAPFLTVYSGGGLINARAAPDEVLTSIPHLMRTDIEKLRSTPNALEQNDPALLDIRQRVGAYLSDTAGPAFFVTVEELRADGGHGSSAVYVVVTGLDAQAPYRLIAKKPAGVGQLSGAS